MQTLAGLSALTRLRVEFGVGSSLAPRTNELECLRSRSIEDLSVRLWQVRSGWSRR